MALLTRFDPFRELSSLQHRINYLFDDFFSGRIPEPGEMPETAFAPAADVYEDENQIAVKMEMPGIDEKDLKITLENQTLTVSGERKFEHEEKKENFRRMERRYGAFTRSFTLPSTVDSENVSADYKNGVLNIRFNKLAEAKPKTIKISTTPKAIKAA